jgi:hypothetical protein
VTGVVRFAVSLAGFLRQPTRVADARAAIRQQLGEREQSFLDLAARAVYANPKSPYRRLLQHAGIDLAGLAAMVQTHGLEQALARLYDAGVYVTYEELRGRKPIRRGELEFSVKVSDFDNPLITPFYEAHTSGSRSAGTRVYVDLREIARESGHIACFLDANASLGRPAAVWRLRPPSTTGFGAMLRYTRVGMRPKAWFAQDRARLRNGGWRGFVYLVYSLTISYLVRQPFPWPRYAPPDQGIVLARWLADQKRRGTPGFVDASVSGATRICIAATENGIDISGSIFRVGGEPLTEAKAKIIVATGSRVITRYQMVETGIIALGCANPAAVDDMHVVMEKIVVVQRDKVVGSGGETVPALVYTSLQPTCQTIMLNAESGDYGNLEERDCGCPLGELGYSLHLSGIRGYDKLTSDGVTFLGSELYRLVDEVLPAKFGGHATDYQLVEEEVGGIPKVSIVVSERVGVIDEPAVIAAVLAELRRHYTIGPLMADQWRDGQVLRVVRREPYTSGGRKILPLHILRK